MRVDRIASFLESKGIEVNILKVKKLRDIFRLYLTVRSSSKDDCFVYENIGVSLVGLIMPKSTKILDYHGSIYDASFKKDFAVRKKLYFLAEYLIVKRWSRIIVVSEAFRLQLKRKYTDRLRTSVKVVPNIPEIIPAYPLPSKDIKELRVVYVGGTQAWQRVNDMIAWLNGLSEHAQHVNRRLICTFVSKELAQFNDLLNGVDFQYELYSTNLDGVFKELAKSDFAILLRHSDEINKVACPTKAVEYLLAGVPVIASSGIGDISALIERYNAGIILREPLISSTNFVEVLSYDKSGQVPESYFSLDKYENFLL